MTRTLWDASTPPSSPPAADGFMIYCGGDTPHVWTDAEIAAQPASALRLPVFVRSNPTDAQQAQADAAAMLQWLHDHGVPSGVAVLWDLETAVAPAYVSAVGVAMHAAHFLVLPYGSRSSLFSNPALDGYVDAHPDAAGIDPGCVGTQYKFAGAYDLSLIADSVPLWAPAQPAPPAPPPAPQPAPHPPEVVMVNVSVPQLQLQQPYMRGPWVAVVQHRVGVPEDGLYGPQTQAAVRTFQSAHGLAVDGIVGPQTGARILNG